MISTGIGREMSTAEKGRILVPESSVRETELISREFIGIVMIAANVCINVASMELMQCMETKFDFKQPIFIVYVHHSIGCICLPIGLVVLSRQGVTLAEALRQLAPHRMHCALPPPSQCICCPAGRSV